MKISSIDESVISASRFSDFKSFRRSTRNLATLLDSAVVCPSPLRILISIISASSALHIQTTRGGPDWSCSHPFTHDLLEQGLLSFDNVGIKLFPCFPSMTGHSWDINISLPDIREATARLPWLRCVCLTSSSIFREIHRYQIALCQLDN